MKRPPQFVLVKTGNISPEQYDVFLKHPQIDVGMPHPITYTQVGYLRMRWGCFTVECPDVGERLVYQSNVGDPLQGCFDDDEQRAFHIKQAKIAIYTWLVSNEWTVNGVNLLEVINGSAEGDRGSDPKSQRGSEVDKEGG